MGQWVYPDRGEIQRREQVKLTHAHRRVAPPPAQTTPAATAMPNASRMIITHVTVAVSASTSVSE